MTDRELLELAAKAAGYGIDQDPPDNDGLWLLGDAPAWWNPLTDDDDALRLAVKLGISVFIGTDTIEAYTSQEDGKLQQNEGDFYAATRRAIVRAAAEIGKAMP